MLIDMNPLISIIVPVYNAEKTLGRCVDSILNQTFQDWELLLIDDGSTDRSGKLCDEYALKDQRIKVFHKKNGGVSSARNIGLNHAKGKWITFIDSDDEIPKNTFTDDCRYFEEDLIVGAFNSIIDGEIQCSRLDAGFYNKQDLLRFFSHNINASTFRVVWGKLFRKSLCKGLLFDTNMNVGEDTLFVMQYLARIESCRIIGDIIYTYNLPNNFITKYKLDITKSIYCLDKIYSSYKMLGVHSKFFEQTIFFDYKLFCQKNIYSNVDLWYKDTRIRDIYNQIKNSFSIKYRILYTLMSYQYISNLVSRFRGYNNL